VSRKAPEGAVVRLYLDDPVQPIKSGDAVVTATTGRSYRVISARQSEVNGRWRLVVRVISPTGVLRDDVVHTLTWYSRSPKRPTRRQRLAALERSG